MANDDRQINPASSCASRLGQLLSIKGDLSGGEDLAVEGRVSGKIDLGRHDLVILKGGKVEAEITARNITVHGELTGNISALEKVFISETGQVKGDISAARVSIVEGAHFRGAIKITKSDLS